MLSGSVIMQRLMLILWEQTGGEEGINGIEPLIRSTLCAAGVAVTVYDLPVQQG